MLKYYFYAKILFKNNPIVWIKIKKHTSFFAIIIQLVLKWQILNKTKLGISNNEK